MPSQLSGLDDEIDKLLNDAESGFQARKGSHSPTLPGRYGVRPSQRAQREGVAIFTPGVGSSRLIPLHMFL